MLTVPGLIKHVGFNFSLLRILGLDGSTQQTRTLHSSLMVENSDGAAEEVDEHTWWVKL